MGRRMVARRAPSRPVGAAAAAAGLFVGVGVGMLSIRDRRHGARADRSQSPRWRYRRPSPVERSAGGRIDDDAFLSELEWRSADALHPELLAFDALTPRVAGPDQYSISR